MVRKLPKKCYDQARLYALEKEPDLIDEDYSRTDRA